MKRNITKRILILSSFLMMGSLVGCKNKSGNVWTHFKANAPTEQSVGNVEFWVKENGTISLKKPTNGEIVEGGTPKQSDYSNHPEIWIENELKVTTGKNSFIIPLEEFPAKYYAKGADYSASSLKIIKDVTLKSAWTAIGTKEKPFTGTFDGNNKKITGLSINTENEYQGLFGVASGATFKDLSLKNVNITSGGLAGGVVGFVNGGDVLIQNCHVLSGTIKSEIFDDLGGMVGGVYDPTQNMTIKNCSNSAKVESQVSPGRVGGMIGLAGPQVSLLLENCVNNGEIVSENSSAMVGGTRGQAQGATFTFKNCTNNGTANVPYVGFFNSAANSQEYLKVVIENEATTEEMLPTLFSVWQSGGTEGGYLSLTMNNEEYKYFLIPTYTYSTTQGKIVSLSKVNSVAKPLNKAEITNATPEEWAEFLAINPKAAIYNEDGTFKGVSPTTNCYAPNNYYIKGSQFGGFVNTWVKVASV